MFNDNKVVDLYKRIISEKASVNDFFRFTEYFLSRSANHYDYEKLLSLIRDKAKDQE